MQIAPRPAWTLISDILNETNKPVKILCLGGFTNLAKMLRKHPQTCLDMIKSIFAMAGAISVDGNIGSPSTTPGPNGTRDRYTPATTARSGIFS